jgi:hypothetical protein
MSSKTASSKKTAISAISSKSISPAVSSKKRLDKLEGYEKFKEVTKEFLNDLIQNHSDEDDKDDYNSETIDGLFDQYMETLETFAEINIEKMYNSSSEITIQDIVSCLHKKKTISSREPSQKKLENQERIKKIASDWKELDDDTKQIWTGRAETIYVINVAEAGTTDGVKQMNGYNLFMKYYTDDWVDPDEETQQKAIKKFQQIAKSKVKKGSSTA